jgi:hypothetical protein
MTTKPTFTRADFVRQRRSDKGKAAPRDRKPASSHRRAYRSETLYLPVEPRLRREAQTARQARQARGSSRAQRNDMTFRLGRADVHAPAIGLPQFDFANPRWISGAVALALAALLFLLWTSSPFTVVAAEVIGNQRIGANEINAVLGLVGEPVFKAAPAQIEANLRTAYHDLADVHVRVGLPNRITVEVVERTPVIAWFQSDAMTWIDTEGIAFQPRGEVSGLVQVVATGTPLDVQNDLDLPSYEQQFIAPDVVQIIISMAPYVPSGMPMAYDPKYGIGWQDPRGWSVYFGQSTQDMSMKVTIYQALVERLVSQGIQPSVISMEYLDAPFYK